MLILVYHPFPFASLRSEGDVKDLKYPRASFISAVFTSISDRITKNWKRKQSIELIREAVLTSQRDKRQKGRSMNYELFFLFHHLNMCRLRDKSFIDKIIDKITLSLLFPNNLKFKTNCLTLNTHIGYKISSNYQRHRLQCLYETSSRD